MIKMTMQDFITAYKHNLSLYIDIHFIKPEAQDEPLASFFIKNIDVRSLPLTWRNLKAQDAKIDTAIIENSLFEMARHEHVELVDNDGLPAGEQHLHEACNKTMEAFVTQKLTAWLATQN